MGHRCHVITVLPAPSTPGPFETKIMTGHRSGAHVLWERAVRDAADVMPNWEPRQLRAPVIAPTHNDIIQYFQALNDVTSIAVCATAALPSCR